ncbi:hypothetical protein [Aggregatibacter kilianii]|uniref:hypothetical protein n=1 Tax=Aggregatibacter kilianii TaxID=2025884 RepID=UPI000D651A0C|nr:hypothetical protein [Aggregatibacter kilianii]
MKKLLLILVVGGCLTACSSKAPQANRAPLDTQAVEAYQAKVYSGNTVSKKYQVKDNKPEDNVLNASDSEPKAVIYRERQPRFVVAPSIGYYRGWHHW